MKVSIKSKFDIYKCFIIVIYVGCYLSVTVIIYYNDLMRWVVLHDTIAVSFHIALIYAMLK